MAGRRRLGTSPWMKMLEASLGCGSCGKGRFIRQLPRGFHIWTPKSKEIFHKEFKFVASSASISCRAALNSCL